MKQNSLVMVEWVDIQDSSEEDWNDPSVLNTTANVKAVGWLFRDFTRKSTTLYLSTDWCPDENRYSGKRSIPAGCILNIRKVAVDTLEEWENVGTKWSVVPIGD